MPRDGSQWFSPAMPIETAEPTVLMSEPDLAALIVVSVNTVRRWRETGNGPRCVKAGERFFYLPSDVQEWLDAKVAESQAERQALSR